MGHFLGEFPFFFLKNCVPSMEYHIVDVCCRCDGKNVV